MADTQSTLSSVGSGATTGAAIGSVIPVLGTGVGALVGGAAGLIGSLLNRKKSPPAVTLPPWQDIPGYQTTDLTTEQKKATQANLAQEGDIEQLLARANKFNQGQATGLMEQAVPGWGKLSQKFLQTSDQLLTNPYDVPADVQANLTRIAAERGISSGARGQFSQFSLLRDLGVNALNYGQSRISQAQGLLQLVGSLAPRVNPLSPMSFYATPAQYAQIDQQNAQGILQGNLINAQGRQGVLGANQAANQGALNASVNADNYNTENRWRSIAGFVSMMPSLIPKGNDRAGVGAPTTADAFFGTNQAPQVDTNFDMGQPKRGLINPNYSLVGTGGP